jgi:hypothetical protein
VPFPVSKLDKLIERVGSVIGGAPRVHAGVQFDSLKGMGGVPDAANVDYRGFTAYMRPRQFLQINPQRDLDTRPIDHILSAIDDGQPIGTPIVYVDRAKDGSWQVRGHEGRGRMTALHQRSPGEYFPVAVHPYGSTRAHDLSPEDALSWLRPDEGGYLPARPAVSILGGKPHVGPSDAEFFQQHGVHPALEKLLQELQPQGGIR